MIYLYIFTTTERFHYFSCDICSSQLTLYSILNITNTVQVYLDCKSYIHRCNRVAFVFSFQCLFFIKERFSVRSQVKNVKRINFHILFSVFFLRQKTPLNFYLQSSYKVFPVPVRQCAFLLLALSTLSPISGSIITKI